MRLSGPSPVPIFVRTGRFAVGTVCPAVPAPCEVLPLPALLLLLPLLQPAATTDTTASPSAIFMGRVRPVVLFIGYPPLGSGPDRVPAGLRMPARSARRCAPGRPGHGRRARARVPPRSAG